MTKLSCIVVLGLASGATIIAAQPRSRESESRESELHERESASSSVAVVVSGRVSLLAPSDRDARDVANAVVFLEPLATPRAPTPPPVVAPVAAAPAPARTPTDTIGMLWNAVRELRLTVAELRDALRQLRAGFRGPDARVESPAPTTRDTTIAPLGTPAPSATAVGVPTGAPAGTPGGTVERPRPVARVIAPTSIAMRDKVFEPHVRIVEAGGLVEYPNRDPFSHNVFSTTPGGAFDLGLYPRGESRGVVFRRAGSYAIYCNIHSKMSAFVVTVPSPYHVRPDAAGRFILEGVSPGRYRLHAWHERAAEQTTTITVGDRALTDVALTLDARGFQPESHLNKFGQPYRAATRSVY